MGAPHNPGVSRPSYLHAAVSQFVDRLRELSDATDAGDTLAAAVGEAVEKLANVIVEEARGTDADDAGGTEDG